MKRPTLPAGASSRTAVASPAGSPVRGGHTYGGASQERSAAGFSTAPFTIRRLVPREERVVFLPVVACRLCRDEFVGSDAAETLCRRCGGRP